MAYKFVLVAVFMVLVSVAIARPQSAREDAKISGTLKDFIMADQAGMIFLFSRESPKSIVVPLIHESSIPSAKK